MLAVCVLLALGGALAVPLSASATTFAVTDSTDDPATTVGSLRSAVAQAASGDTIVFAPAVTSIVLGATVVLSSGVTIDGTDHLTLSPGAGMTDALLTIAPTAPDQDFTIEFLELTGAVAADSRGLLVTAGPDLARNVTVSQASLTGFRDDAGSAIDVQQIAGRFTVDTSRIESNLATGGGGAAIADSSPTGTAVVISNTTIAANITASGTASDGAVSIGGNATAAISFTGDTIANNVVGAAGSSVLGAGVSLGADGNPIGAVTISGSTFSGNGTVSSPGLVAPFGGGGLYIGHASSVTIGTSIFRGNEAQQAGGGVLLDTITGDVTLDTVTLDGNVVTGGPGGPSGGGLFAGGVTGSVTATGLLVENNTADDSGGGLVLVSIGGGFAIGTSTFTANTGVTGSGLFAPDVTADSTVTASTFSGNVSTGGGGAGIFVLEVDPGASFVVQSSTFTGNSFAPGPACGCGPTGLSLYVPVVLGEVGVAESTFDETASASPANAIQIDNLTGSGTFGLANSTVVGGLGLDLGDLDSTGIARVSHSIVQVPSGTDAITVDGVGAAQALDVRWSLLSSGLGANQTDTVGNQLNTDAQLAALANNGGPTRTMLPLTGSPAIDSGDPAFSDPVTVDQRGLTRIVRIIDIGAVEVQTTAPARLPATGAPIGGGLAAAVLLLVLGAGALLLRRRRLS